MRQKLANILTTLPPEKEDFFRNTLFELTKKTNEKDILTRSGLTIDYSYENQQDINNEDYEYFFQDY